MIRVDCDKYLGDILSSDCSNDLNIDKKVAKGIGIVAQIMALLSEISLGCHYFEIALIMRESLFINGIFTNMEVAYDLTEAQITRLEEVDKILLRKILNAHSKTPRESLYLETGTIPLRYLIKSRRIMYLHHILTRKPDALLLQTFQAQNKFPVKGDWSLTVADNLNELDINLNYDTIKKLSKRTFKKYLRQKVMQSAFRHLMEEKNVHTKMDNISYSKLETQKYLLSKTMFPEISKFLYKCRTRMLDVKCNFKNLYKCLLCPLCEKEEDSQEHIMNCEIINDGENENEYLDIFGTNIEKQVKVARVLMEALEERRKIIEASDS